MITGILQSRECALDHVRHQTQVRHSANNIQQTVDRFGALVSCDRPQILQHFTVAFFHFFETAQLVKQGDQVLERFEPPFYLLPCGSDD